MFKSEGLPGLRRTFGDPNFRNFQLGSFVNWVGGWTYRTGLGWLVWELTESPAWLGIIGFADLAPAVFATPLAGALADRVERLRFVRIVVVLAAIQALALGLLVLTGHATIWIVVALTFAHGTIEATLQPPIHAFIPSLVRREDLTAAYAVNSLSFNLSRFIGPVIAGVLVNAFGSASAILVYALGGFSFAVMLLYIDVKETLPEKRPERRMMAEIREGIVYTARHEGLGPLMVSLAGASVLAFPIINLLPGFAEGVFKSGAHGLAWLTAAMGLGAMVQAAYLAQRGPIRGLTAYVVAHILLITVFLMALTATDVFWVGFLAMVGLGYATVCNRSGVMTLMQTAAAGEMRGRVASFYGVVTRACPAVGALVIGALGEVFGLRVAVAGAALLIALLWAWMNRRKERIADAIEG